MRKESAAKYFNMIALKLPGETEVNHEFPQPAFVLGIDTRTP